MGDDTIDMVILHIDMGYLVTLIPTCAVLLSLSLLFALAPLLVVLFAPRAPATARRHIEPDDPDLASCVPPAPGFRARHMLSITSSTPI
jgi:hypothetical protein